MLRNNGRHSCCVDVRSAQLMCQLLSKSDSAADNSLVTAVNARLGLAFKSSLVELCPVCTKCILTCLYQFIMLYCNYTNYCFMLWYYFMCVLWPDASFRRLTLTPFSCDLQVAFTRQLCQRTFVWWVTVGHSIDSCETVL